MVFKSKLKGKHWSCCSYQTSPHAVPYLYNVDTYDMIFQMPISHRIFRWGTGITKTWKYVCSAGSRICGGSQFLEEFSNFFLIFFFFYIFSAYWTPHCLSAKDRGRNFTWEPDALLYTSVFTGAKNPLNAWPWNGMSIGCWHTRVRPVFFSKVCWW